MRSSKLLNHSNAVFLHCISVVNLDNNGFKSACQESNKRSTHEDDVSPAFNNSNIKNPVRCDMIYINAISFSHLRNEEWFVSMC